MSISNETIIFFHAINAIRCRFKCKFYDDDPLLKNLDNVATVSQYNIDDVGYTAAVAANKAFLAYNLPVTATTTVDTSSATINAPNTIADKENYVISIENAKSAAFAASVIQSEENTVSDVEVKVESIIQSALNADILLDKDIKENLQLSVEDAISAAFTASIVTIVFAVNAVNAALKSLNNKEKTKIYKLNNLILKIRSTIQSAVESAKSGDYVKRDYIPCIANAAIECLIACINIY